MKKLIFNIGLILLLSGCTFFSTQSSQVENNSNANINVFNDFEGEISNYSYNGIKKDEIFGKKIVYVDENTSGYFRNIESSKIWVDRASRIMYGESIGDVKIKVNIDEYNPTRFDIIKNLQRDAFLDLINNDSFYEEGEEDSGTYMVYYEDSYLMKKTGAVFATIALFFEQENINVTIYFSDIESFKNIDINEFVNLAKEIINTKEFK